MTFDKSAFHSYNEQPKDRRITLGDRRTVKVQGIGDIKVSLSVNGIETTTTFFSVLHSLLSVARVIERGESCF
jgi:hypothetical protein